MTIRLEAAAHATGRRVDLRVVVERPTGAAAVPALRLVRRRLAHPAAPGDGVPVADLSALFVSPAQTWRRLERLRPFPLGR